MATVTIKFQNNWSQLVYLIHFDQLSLSPLKTQAIFIILAVLVTKRIQHVLPKL